jgi:DNA-binding NtrC family response regulator
VSHRWKGNVRELRSALEQALLLSAGAELTTADLLGATNDGGGPAPTSFRDAKERAVQGFERDFLLQALRRHGGNITKAAEDVGMYRQNFQQKMRELGISVDDAVKPGDA